MAGKKVDPVTGEVAIVEAVTAATEVAPREGDVISQYLFTETDKTTVVAADAHKAIVEEIFEATTLEELLAKTEAEKLEAYDGRVITIRAFTPNESEFPGGPPVYFTMKITDEETGERRIVNTGEQNVMAQLLKAERLGLLPFKCRPYAASKANQFGRYLMRLGPAED